MSWKNGHVLNISTNSTLLLSLRGAGFHMISEMIIPVLRLEGPIGSLGSISAATTELVGVLA